jgi:hypothetical protein
MGTLTAQGISARLPSGFDGRIFRRATGGPETAMPVAQFATFHLPPDTGDFGISAVALMSAHDAFVVLFEYGPESLGKPLFARQGMPRRLDPDHFRPYTLRRGQAGQAGTQWFFTESGRPFTLYAALGSMQARFSVVPRVNSLLKLIVIDPPRPVVGATAALESKPPLTT